MKIFKKTKWFLKQLFPLKYQSRCFDCDGIEWKTIWRMWFGKCFNIERNIISIKKVKSK